MNSSRTSPNKVKKRPTNNSNVKKKKGSSSTNATPRKKKVVNSTTKKSSNKPKSTKKVVKKSVPKKKEVEPVKKKKVKKVESNVQDLDELFIQDIEYVDEDYDRDDFQEYENNNPNTVVKKKPKKIDNKEDEIKEEKRERLVSPLTVITISFVIAIIIATAYLMFTLEYFNLTNIEVVGNTKYTNEKIIENCSLKIGDNVFKDLLSKSYNVSEIPYISNLKYRYKFPSEIVVQVEERYPEYVAKDKNSDKCYMLDNQGYILEECSTETKGDTLFVEGLSFEEKVDFGKQIDEVYLRKLKKYKEIKQLLEEAQLPTNITKVNFNASLTIITMDDKLNIVFSNESDLRYRVSFLKTIIAQNGTIEEGTIDMSLENPVYSKYD